MNPLNYLPRSDQLKVAIVTPPPHKPEVLPAQTGTVQLEGARPPAATRRWPTAVAPNAALSASASLGLGWVEQDGHEAVICVIGRHERAEFC